MRRFKEELFVVAVAEFDFCVSFFIIFSVLVRVVAKAFKVCI